MNRSIPFGTATLPLPHPIRQSASQRGFPVVLLALALFAFPQIAPAVTPAPDGGYAGNNTVEGSGALQSLATGTENMAIGFDTLFFNAVGGANTAIGASAFKDNTTGRENTAAGASALFKYDRH